MRTVRNAADMIINNRWLICQCIFLAYISVLAIMDFRSRKLPLKFLLSGFLIVAGGWICREDLSPVLAAAGGCTGLVFLFISRISGEAFGYGDSILILVIGCFIGFWDLMYLLLGAFSIAAVFSAAMMIRHRFNRKSSFPFVPFLAAAYMGGMFIGAY
ncbi:MAG TPA: A24 family peptidase [Candidatus Mediterraneibacter tabaqchaliae]|uniref:A24 family peptidase n=1 Tax=Candidatus Mediterraneibacter tabaqchaliae TaxID=2838689 RepID=A0A9D2R5M9_9FIRM|nr:A24 family peptidase [Candidatus Mediterraneibacter tabaqchaliae]